jgi:hypothetical protein
MLQGVFNGTHMKIYINGEKNAESYIGGGTNDNHIYLTHVDGLYIGGGGVSSKTNPLQNYYAYGDIDELRLYDRVLSDIEINNLYELKSISCLDGDNDGYSVVGGECREIDCDESDSKIYQSCGNAGEGSLCINSFIEIENQFMPTSSTLYIEDLQTGQWISKGTDQHICINLETGVRRIRLAKLEFEDLVTEFKIDEGKTIYYQAYFNNDFCTESDGGINYYMNGLGKGLDELRNNISFYDSCYKDYWANLVKNCSGTGCYLAERYCSYSYVGLKIGINCINGCNNGYCNPFCTDSDNGVNSFVKGTTTSCNNTGCTSSIDKCLSSFSGRSYVMEYYCSNNKTYAFPYTCSEGCTDGACNPENLIRYQNISSSAWTAYWVKPTITAGKLDSFGTNNAYEMASKDYNFPSNNESGLIYPRTLTIGKNYTLSVWLRSTGARINGRLGFNDIDRIYFSLTDNNWKFINYTATITSTQNRTFQVVETTGKNSAWQIAYPRVEEVV